MAATYKIEKSNTSSYNIIAHDQYVPPSPPFGPAPRQTLRIDPDTDYEVPGGEGDQRQHADIRDERGRDGWTEKENSHQQRPNYQTTSEYYHHDPLIKHNQHMPFSPLYRPGQGQGPSQGDPRYANGREGDATYRGTRDFQGNNQLAEGRDASQRYQNIKGYGSLGNTIGNINHVPVSPLYRPGMGRGLTMADPRHGSQHGGRQVGFQEVQRPKHPPTPDYNTTQLHIDNNEDTRLKIDGMRGSQEDLRDYKTNRASWAGYQDRPVHYGPPHTDRPGYGGDRTYRESPWSSRKLVPDYVTDPRVGGHHDGIDLSGNRNGGCLLFIRFPIGQGENVSVAAQAFLKSKTHDNGGRFLGLAKRVYNFGYESGPIEGMGVFHFPSMEKASMFFQMDPLIRQPDFPAPSGHSEVWAVNNAYLPDNLQLFDTYLLSEIELHSGKTKREFFDTFQKPFENYLYKNGAMPFAICSYGPSDRKSLRRHHYPPTSLVTCHLFQGLDHLNWITNDETYSKFRSVHNQIATERCSIFTITRDMFP